MNDNELRMRMGHEEEIGWVVLFVFTWGQWYITVISVALFIYSETKAYDKFLKVCSSEECQDLFLLSAEEAQTLLSYGMSMSFYSGILVVLLLIQFLSFFSVKFASFMYMA